jgi:DNA-binding beta-propeller fold protein YncE
MRSLACLLLALAACGNDLPPPGMCAVPTSGEMPVVDHVPLAGHAAGYDDLRYAPQLGKVLAVPSGVARLYLVDPDTLDVQTTAVPGGSESMDASATTIYVLDRGGGRILAIDAATMLQTASQGTSGPDYVRFSPTSSEVWVTLPARRQIQILDGATLAPLGKVDIPGGPEGLTFDASGLAYTQSGGRMIQIDVARRTVIADWDTGCASSHGFPQIDEAYGLAIAGCSSSGGIGVTATATRDMLAGFEAGGGAAILAHDATTHHLFVRGDPGTTLDILAVCSDGGTSVLASVALSMNGHGATVDDRGHAWVADANTGAVFRITDPFPPTH